MPTRKDNTNVAPIYREQVFIPASGATLMKQKARPKIAGRTVSSGAIEIVSPEFDLLTGIRGIATLKNLPINITSKNAHKIKDKDWDKLYNAAIDKGNVEEIKRLRDLHFQAKSRNNFIINEDGTPKHLYHATKNKFNSFDLNKAGTGSGNLSNTEGVVYFSPYKEASLDVFRPKKSEVNDFNIMDLYVNNANPVNVKLSDFIKTWNNKEEFLKLRNAGEGIIAKGIKTPQQYYDEAVKKYLEKEKSGTLSIFDRKPESVKEFMEEQLVDNYTINNPNNIKSAKAITYDDNGNLIPLSKRDNFNINDIRMKCGGRRKAQLGLDIREGGIAIPIAPNMYYMNGRSHDEGGIGIGPNNKNGLEVEGGEVVKVGDKDIKVFSGVPLLRGVSPAQLVMGGANPNKVFKAQEEFKDRNRINDDGTHYEVGGEKRIYTPSKSTQRQIQETGKITIGGAPTIGGLRTRAYMYGLKQAIKYPAKVSNAIRNIGGKIKQYLADKSFSYEPDFVPMKTWKYATGRVLNQQVTGNKGSAWVRTGKLISDAINDEEKEMKAGGIYIKPSKRGTFTAAAKKRGMGVQEFASKVLANKEDYSPAMVKKANFARNASHWKKEFGGSMIYEINGNVKKGLMSARPKAVLGKQRKVEGYGNTIIVDDDTFMLNEDGIYVPVNNVQINKQPKTLRGASGRRDIAYDRQGNRYQRRSDGSLIKVSPEKGNIAVSDTIRGVEVNAPDVTKTRSIKQIKAATKVTNPKNNPPRQKVEPDFGIGTQTVVNFLRNNNGKYNTQRSPIHSFTPAQKLGLSSYGWSTYDDPNKGYSFREDAAAVKSGQKSVDEIIGQDLSQINFDNNQSGSTPRRGETKPISVKATVASKPLTKGADTKYGTPLAEKKESLYMTGIKNNVLTPIRTGMEKIKSPSSTGGETQSSKGRWIGQYKTTNVGDWIGLGSNLAGTIASYFMTKNAVNKMPDPIKPIMAQAAKLKTRYNIEPQLTNIREAEQMNRAVVRRNTQSSNTSLAREQRLMNEARGSRNVLYGQKENIETQLINQDRMNRQAVAAQNIATYNDYLTRLYAGKVSQNQLGISSINNLLSGLTGSVNNILGTIESRRATNNTLRAIAAANPNVDARLIGGFDYYIDPITKRKYNKNQQYIGTINV